MANEPLEIPGFDQLTTNTVVLTRSEGVPWAVWVYLSLFAMFLALLLVSACLSKGIQPEAHPLTKLFTIASDGLKTVLGALLGSLSLATEYHFRRAGKPK